MLQCQVGKSEIGRLKDVISVYDTHTVLFKLKLKMYRQTDRSQSFSSE